MQAIRVSRFGGPEVLQLQDVPEPDVGAGQVRVTIQAIGVNPVDTYIRTGTYAVKPDLPYTPGMDAAGVVDAVGEGVDHLRVGDRVYTARTLTGAYAAKCLCDPSQVWPLPERVSFEQGAAVFVPYATALRGLFHMARSRPTESLLVHGASGGVGIAAVQLGRAAGMTVIGTAGTERGQELVAQEGAHHVLDHSSPDYLEAISGITGDHGVNVILEMLANVNLEKDLGVAAKGGRIVVIGSRGRIEIDPRGAMARDVSIIGMSLLNAPLDELRLIHAALLPGLENGSLRPIVGKQFPLSEAQGAHIAVMESGAYGKIVLKP